MKSRPFQSAGETPRDVSDMGACFSVTDRLMPVFLSKVNQRSSVMTDCVFRKTMVGTLKYSPVTLIWFFVT